MSVKEELKKVLIGQMTRHKINAEALINNSVGIAEHPDIVATIEEELGKIAEYNDKLLALEDISDG